MEIFHCHYQFNLFGRHKLYSIEIKLILELSAAKLHGINFDIKDGINICLSYSVLHSDISANNKNRKLSLKNIIFNIDVF